uniref:Uncharacterized protein n=1 Tax=Anguilla anguilla TaxID=7936 RepID=A0A0E9WIV3_ANGAN
MFLHVDIPGDGTDGKPVVTRPRERAFSRLASRLPCSLCRPGAWRSVGVCVGN